MIKEFIENQKGGRDFLNEMKSSQISEPEQCRKNFTKYLADYTISIYGVQPSTANMKNVAIPASGLFPELMLSAVRYINNSNESYIIYNTFWYDRMFW